MVEMTDYENILLNNILSEIKNIDSRLDKVEQQLAGMGAVSKFWSGLAGGSLVGLLLNLANIIDKVKGWMS